MFDLKDLESSLKLLIYEDENLLDFVFSRLIIRALRVHSLRLDSASSSRGREFRGDCAIVE